MTTQEAAIAVRPQVWIELDESPPRAISQLLARAEMYEHMQSADKLAKPCMAECHKATATRIRDVAVQLHNSHRQQTINQKLQTGAVRNLGAR